jgi:hypothetical protein
MDVQTMLKRLIDAGLSQDRIVELVKAYGGNTNQSNISRMIRGGGCRYELGCVIRRVYFEVCELDRGAA